MYKIAKYYGRMTAKGMMALCLFALVSVICQSQAWAIIDGGPHDLRDSGAGFFTFATSQMCIFCHAAHGSNKNFTTATICNTSSGCTNAVAGAPSTLLWNRSLPDATVYNLYTSSTLDASAVEVRVYSMMCLSCHDGITAINAIYRQARDEGAVDISPADGYPDQIGMYTSFSDLGSGGPNIGGRMLSSDPMNLSDDHPISIDYPTTDAGLRTPDAAGFVNIPQIRLFKNPRNGNLTSLECSTCHDVHNYGDALAGTAPFLVTTNDNSALCMQCHLK